MLINEARYCVVQYLNQEGDKKVREIKVAVGIDEEFLSLYDNNFIKCCQVIDKVFKRTSNLYKSDFGIEFKVNKYEKYKSNDSLENGLWRMLEASYKINCDSNDLRIVFTGQTLIKGDKLLGGIAMELSNISLIRAYEPVHWEYWLGKTRDEIIIDNLEMTVKHEIGHIFGAVHVKGDAYIMNKYGSGFMFCNPNKEIIKKNKYRFFF